MIDEHEVPPLDAYDVELLQQGAACDSPRGVCNHFPQNVTLNSNVAKEAVVTWNARVYGSTRKIQKKVQNLRRNWATPTVEAWFASWTRQLDCSRPKFNNFFGFLNRSTKEPDIFFERDCL